MTPARTGVVVMAYGTPRSPAEVEPYYTHIRRGRRPEPDLLADLVARYLAIGGLSPLADRSEAQRARLQDILDQRAPGQFTVVLGHKHAPPFIEDAIAALDGRVASVVGLVLAPHYSRASVGEYAARLELATPVPTMMIRSWHDLPELHAFLATQLRAELDPMPVRTKVLFTAHSLPLRVLDDDPYEAELRATATAVARQAGLHPWAQWALAWQSAGRTPDPWKGPDLRAVIRDLAATGDVDGVLVCPQGFASDHLEVLYDLDIEARGVAAEVGLAFGRTPSINDDPGVFSGLADRVMATA